MLLLVRLLLLLLLLLIGGIRAISAYVLLAPLVTLVVASVAMYCGLGWLVVGCGGAVGRSLAEGDGEGGVTCAGSCVVAP